ncbi:chromatin remodelling complex Rsc7/Swp82 subunit-domain-containing protein [Lipomyces arxii]|uniref:chromatin remodelling complex Rsc7/Swp82 subunit-domain-containing protein n=1 Tax=Lipomyces arxii TaxID=56418 RepID=UPI0034CEDE00
MADSNDSDASTGSSGLYKHSRSSSVSSAALKRAKFDQNSDISSKSRSSTPLAATRKKASAYSDYSDSEAESKGATASNAHETNSDNDEDIEEGEIEEEGFGNTVVPSRTRSKDDDDEDEYHDDGDDDDDDKEEGEIEDIKSKDLDLDDAVLNDAGEDKSVLNGGDDLESDTKKTKPSVPATAPLRRGAPRGRRRGPGAIGHGRGHGHRGGFHGHKAKNQVPQPGSEHTTDVVNEEGDEYVVSDIDPAGESKLTADGNLLGGRQYKTRIFQLPNRGAKYFMMATECAKELNFRDSYLLFNKNRSLFKLIATQADKEALISMGHLPYAYRSRQIALVSARSMFRQFGSLAVVDGRRVKDDYWEKKAVEEGFTENDFAVEKKVIAPLAPLAATPSAPADHIPTFQDSLFLQGMSRGDTIGQIVFGLRGAPKVLDMPEPRIWRLFKASTSNKTDPEDEPVKFTAAQSRGTRADTTTRASLDDMVEAAASAVEFNAFLSRKRVARNQMWKTFWKPKSAAKASTEQLGQDDAPKAGTGVDEFDESHDSVILDSVMRDSPFQV